MAPPTHRVRLRTLVSQELRALPRNTFALGAIAAVFGLLAVPVSALMAGEAGLDEPLLLTWFVLPLVVAIVVAARVASARRTRFVDSLYTTPLTQSTWMAAQATVGAVLGILALAVQVPFLLVFVLWLGVPSILLPAALAALGIALFAVALGLFCGVVVGDAPPMAAAGLAGGFAFLSFILFLVHSIALAEPPTAARDILLRFTALSPIVLAADASGMSIAGMTPGDAWRPVVGLVVLAAGLAGAAWVAYTRAQNPLGWQPGRGRIAVVALFVTALAAPVATAEVDFVGSPPGIPSYVPGEHTWVAFVERGAPVTKDSFTVPSIMDAPDLPLGQDVAYDVLVLVLSPPDASVRGVHIEVKGSSVVRVVGGGVLSVPTGEPSARVPAPNDGHLRPVYRVPVTLRAGSVEELGDSPAPVEVHTSFKADGKSLASVGRMILDAGIPGAFGQLVAAGLVLPAVALLGSILRRRSTR
jgi:hypothetical protein